MPPVLIRLAFQYDNGVTVYYLPGTTGWSTTFGGRPTAPWLLPNPLILNNGSGFWRENQWVRLRHLLGNEHPCRCGSLHRPSQSAVVSGGNQHSDKRLVLFQ